MPHDFRTERANRLFGPETTKSIKVFVKSNAGLPLPIDYVNRYAIFYTQGEQFLQRIHNFEVRKDDVWVITMPKCGTTWMLELVWMLLNDLDYATALSVEQEDRCPFLEYCAIFPSITPQSLDVAEQLKSPRVIKSHLPMHMLPKGLWTVKPKIIYVAREPKDAAVSYYHFMSGLGKNRSTKEEFLSSILSDEMSFNPFWLHVVEFWKLRNESYIYFTSFERMKKDLRTTVLQVGKFLQTSVNDQQMEGLLDHLSFEKMKNNPMCNHLKENREAQMILGAEGNSFNFLRKGVVGSHKEDLTEDMIEKFDEWTEKALKPYEVTSKEILFS